MSTESRPDLIDRLMDMYVDWREECDALQQAYERWSGVAAADRSLAFAAYRAALDREEAASRVYRDHLSLIAAVGDQPGDETERESRFVFAAASPDREWSNQ